MSVFDHETAKLLLDMGLITAAALGNLPYTNRNLKKKVTVVSNNLNVTNLVHTFYIPECIFSLGYVKLDITSS